VTTIKKKPIYKDGKKMRTYRLSDATVERLKELSKATGKTMTQVVEELIHAAEVDDELEAEGS
jgi:predicted DNA-binding protein